MSLVVVKSSLVTVEPFLMLESTTNGGGGGVEAKVSTLFYIW